MDATSREGWAHDSIELTKLSLLTPMEYDRVREAKATELGIRVATLDAEIRRLRGVREKSDLDDDPRPPEFTDEAIAIQFSERHGDELRYVAGWGRWLEWTGTQWKVDDTLRSFDRARMLCREISSACNDDRAANGIASAKTVAAVERLAKADRRHAATVDQWDQDVWLLNTPGGVIDLRTGGIGRHRAADHITKTTATAPGGECPMWRSFLAKVTNSNLELQLFLQRMAGLALTGSTREHALFFAYGTGGNGKGVFLNTITGIMGEYAAIASMETFTASQSDRHPADLAMLRGARLVTAQETEEGRRWAESRIKAMTGGDPITARFMRQDFFTFTPQFKLIIAGNHKPGLRNVDEAIRRRFNLVPFDVTIEAADRDPELPEKLRGEWPGILSWMIDGCLLWQEKGLLPPAAVVAATAEYLAAEDAMAIWISECCEVAKTKNDRSSVLYISWKAWAERGGEMPGSQKRFNQALAARGFTLGRDTTNCANFTGLSLKPFEPSEPGYWDR
jgi:putative DNA primase/helicase